MPRVVGQPRQRHRDLRFSGDAAARSAPDYAGRDETAAGVLSVRYFTVLQVLFLEIL